ncbi:MAG TPA: phosphopantetheine-binding protein [Bacillota bacterium]|nr:phosphopantetheine-binding protein [Bacillota bacterium]
MPTYPFERERYWIEPGKRRKQEAEPGLQITNQEDVTKLLKDSSFTPGAVSLSISLSQEDAGMDPTKQREQLEQALRFQESLAEFCQNYFTGAGLRVKVSPVEVKPSKSSDSAGLTGKNQLSKRPRPELITTYTAPRDEMEVIIAECWQNTLGFDRIGIYDDFFELGGHSLLAAAVANELSKIFQIQIPLRNLFETTTIVAIKELIETYRWAAAAQNPAEGGEDMENGEI